jgi:hypothetical protein
VTHQPHQEFTVTLPREHINFLFQTQNKTTMADAAEPSAPPTEAVANMHLDEVTGEKVSKSELKKRNKQRQKEEE